MGPCRALLWSDRLAEAAAAFNAVLEDASALGDDGSVPYTLAHLALTHCLAGDLREAAARAAEGHELSVQAGLASEQAMLLGVRHSSRRTRATPKPAACSPPKPSPSASAAR